MGILAAALKAKLPPPPMRYTGEGLLVPLEKKDWQYRYSAYSVSIFTQDKYLDVKRYIRASKDFVAAAASTTSKEASQMADLPV